jgi:hypothetical protein
MTDTFRAALERLLARLDETTDPNGPVPAWSDSFYAARAALSADGPAVPEGREPAAVVTDPSDAELESFLLGVAAEHGDIYWAEPLVLARAVLARWGHQPPPPAEGEVGELVKWLRGHAVHADQALGSPIDAARFTRVADLLQRQQPVPKGEVAELVAALRDPYIAPLLRERTRAADLLEQRHPAPVPVSERLPGPEDCDAEGCIWLWDTDRRWVRQCRDAAASNSWIGSSWLPGYALPLPAGEVQP